MIETSILATALAIQPAFFEVTDNGHADSDEYINNINILRQAQMPYELLLEERQNFIGRGSDFKTYYTPYQTKDQAIAIGCLSNSLREKAARVIGLEDPRFQPDYDPNNPSNTEKFDANFLLAKKNIASKPVSFWLKAFDNAGVPVGAVKFVEELFEDPQVLANDNVVTLQHEKAGEVKMFGPILKMSETPLKAQFASPALGQHTNELLSLLGYSDDQIETFKKDHVTE
ncbi:MAG: CoA transferase [SAR202 cluster bacterium]|nr:CoA transferase [SAR202 cluster bacterium]